MLCLLLAIRASLVLAGHAEVSPVHKVVELLGEMLAKGKKEKHAEEVGFAKFQEWCEGVRAEKTKYIKEAADQIAQLEADILKAESDTEVLRDEITQLEATMAKNKEEANAATALRKKEHADFSSEEQDLVESIDACGKAVQVLKARSADVPQSLLQVKTAPLVPESAKDAIQSFLDTRNSDDLMAPEANAYEFQSGGVVTMIENLETKFKAQLLELQKAEMSAKGNYQLFMQQFTDNQEQDSKTVAVKTAAKAGRIEDPATAKGELNVTKKGKAEDEQALSDTLAECHVKSKEYEQNQVTRSDEIKAIEQAIAILTSDAVAGNAEKHLPSAALLQSKKGKALAQAVSVLQKDLKLQQRAAAYLQSRSKAIGSRYLAVMAAHTMEDPFSKVKKMIRDLITKLMEEANEEADQHAYCTSELSTNKQTRENKGAEVDKLTAESEQLGAEIAKLGDEISQLSDAVSEMEGERAEATKLRVSEKTENAQVAADAKEAQVAVQQAIEVLRNFYTKPSLLQGKAHGAEHRVAALRKRSAEPYTGMGDSSTGVLGMLEVILSDFARLESETLTAEDLAQTQHQKFMDESAEDIAVKEAEEEHKSGKKQHAEEQLRSTNKELEFTQEELTEALNYYEKLKTDCLDTGLSYADRAKMRQEEIQSLKEAYAILSGEELA